MAKKRTRQDHQKAQLKRIKKARRESLTGNNDSSTSIEANASDQFKKVFGYDLKLVRQDLVRTVVVTLLVCLVLLMIYLYT